MFALKPFQENTIAKLKDQFLNLWKSPHDNIPLIFKSPTGSGKTIMMAQFLRDLVGDPRFYGNNVAFIWITFNEESYIQSKNKLFSYYGGASELDLLDLNDLTRGKLNKNAVFFINWQKIKGTSKESRKLRKDNEWGLTFDSFIEKTKEDGRKLVVIVDEEHIGADTKLADEIFNLISPKITVRISATPKYLPNAEDIAEQKGGFVQAKREDVIEAGLIKEKIIFQTEEDLNRKDFKGVDQDEILLELAYQKRQDLIKHYRNVGAEVNPLVMIQLPNDDQAGKDTTTTNKQAIVLNFLKGKGILEDEIAIWLSQEKVNLEYITDNKSPISFLLFKQAAATGWDCPRASVLVMFREIKNPTFAIQTVGRILRMPFGSHFPIPELNLGYLYTNYKRNEVLTEYEKNKTDNRPAIYGSYRKPEIEPIMIESVFMSRTDYNDLGDSFQETFSDVANQYFGIGKDIPVQALKKLEKKGLETRPIVTNGLIVGVEIDDYDNFTKELIAEGGSHDQEMSQHDLERLYNLLCFKHISRQVDENKKFAPERSWGKLKTALNVWLLKTTEKDRQSIYTIAVNDLLSQTSILAPILGIALEKYRPIREKEVNKKSERSKRIETIEIPRETLFFTDQYEEMSVKKSALKPFYIEKNYKGEGNEKEFIKFLESNKDVVWWYKNGDTGSEFFSISYYNPDENKEKLFYPDWIFKTKNNVWIVDTKKGSTAEIADTKYKAEALQEWFKRKKNFAGGIVVQDGPNGWKVNSNKTYSYSPSFDKWDNLKDVI
ncbi:DEAD/DEAH box helicase family protein [Candidatus Nomurabacteria bacterium]|nr:DEAD/DEAH box helicase family protein [Candidatus Nomurabacteria bacterium]